MHVWYYKVWIEFNNRSAAVIIHDNTQTVFVLNHVDYKLLTCKNNKQNVSKIFANELQNNLKIW